MDISIQLFFSSSSAIHCGSWLIEPLSSSRANFCRPELHTRSFSSPFIQSVESSQEKTLCWPSNQEAVSRWAPCPCVLQLKDCYSTSGSVNFILLQGENNFICSLWWKSFLKSTYNAHNLISSEVRGGYCGDYLVEFVTVCLSVLLLLIECVQLCSNLYLVWHELARIVLI